MKKLRLISTALFIIIIAAACEDGYNFSYSDDGDNSRTVINISDETGTLKMEARGKITFTDDEAAIKSITPGGYIKYRKNGRKLKVQNNAAGEIIYTVDGGSPRATLDGTDKKLLVLVIKEMINTGFDAKGRIERIYNKGGNAAVLSAIDDLRSDYVKSMYFDYLLSTPTLSQDEMAKIAREIGSAIGSDYEKGKLLKKFSANYLENDETATAYLDAVNTINSDYEKANALKDIASQPLTRQQYGQLLNITATIGSDFEKSNVLKQLIKQGLPEESNLTSFLTVTNNINSDFEKSNVLQALVDAGVPGGLSFNKMLDVTTSLGSDYEKGNVLKKLAQKNIPSEDQWISLINITQKVSGDNDRSNILIEVAKKMPDNDRVKTAYRATARTITGDYDYGQAMKAVR